jgi:tetratricopeptide (TPR) repeat protein
MRALLFALLVGCSASATLPDLAAAERRADQGDIEGALTDYRSAQVSCKRLRPERRAKQACSEALLGEAQTLERAGRTNDAIIAYQQIPAKAPDDPMTAATATYRAGELYFDAKSDVEAWTLMWRVVTDYPDEGVAADALKRIVDDGRHRNAQQLADEIAKILTPLAGTEVADNLLWSLAEINEGELGRPDAARDYYDRIPAGYPKSGLRDDARWHAARLSKQLGDYKGAVERLRALLATREVAFGAGSYFSVWLDDAQLELGRILRDNLNDLAGAAGAFEKLPKDYPASILKDDALYELAVTRQKMGDTAAACRAIAKLKKDDPDSKYVDDASAIGAELKCP